MAKYEVISEFNDKVLDRVRKVGETIEAKAERAEHLLKAGVVKIIKDAANGKKDEAKGKKDGKKDANPKAGE